MSEFTDIFVTLAPPPWCLLPSNLEINESGTPEICNESLELAVD